jgi:hypothetical protein
MTHVCDCHCTVGLCCDMFGVTGLRVFPRVLGTALKCFGHCIEVLCTFAARVAMA